MTLERDFSHSFLNLVANHPSVFPWVSTAGLDYIDTSALVLNRENVLLTNEYAAFILVKQDDGVYELHSQILPEGRKSTQKYVAEMLEYMFTCIPCDAVKTYVPEGNLAAKRAARLAGFRFTDRCGTWTYHNGTTVPVDNYIMTKEDWTCRSQA